MHSPVKNPGANMHTICICTTVLLSEKEKREIDKKPKYVYYMVFIWRISINKYLI